MPASQIRFQPFPEERIAEPVFSAMAIIYEAQCDKTVKRTLDGSGACNANMIHEIRREHPCLIHFRKSLENCQLVWGKVFYDGFKAVLLTCKHDCQRLWQIPCGHHSTVIRHTPQRIAQFLHIARNPIGEFNFILLFLSRGIIP